MSHGSARLTVHGRRLIVQRYRAGWKQAHIAAAMGVSRKCVKTWIDRYTAEGQAGLATRSSRPHSMPTKTTPEVEQRVLVARAEHRDGPDVLSAKVGVPARTVSRILRRHCAWAYRWSLRAVCAQHDIKQKFIKPHCPWQNGKVERLNRTLATEWAYRRAFTSNNERTATLAPWLEHYNTERRHSALGGKPPTSRLPPT